ncbi:hypothetical protein [Metabacillus bambusae]|uniref:Uncharacterized protein n=1 Tax=Metabacillus bambusae TaxID=2795218 RepID=A0ABS3MYS7_9BACI|nr:hypothetical protein [Metabacillus bambusae]MBO1511186.1 hypothetical protein [Metabacillus bambusae]
MSEINEEENKFYYHSFIIIVLAISAIVRYFVLDPIELNEYRLQQI